MDRIFKLLKSHLIVTLGMMLFLTVNVSAAISNEMVQNKFNESLSVLDSKINYSTSEKQNTITCIGTLNNSSSITWEELVFEVQFFNSAGEMIDTITDYDYELVSPPNDKITFRVRDVADRSIEEYNSHKVRVTSAVAKKTTNTNKAKSKNNLLVEILISWGPVLLIIAVWAFFISKYNKNSPQNATLAILKDQIDLIKQQNDLFEKLVIAIQGYSKNSLTKE